MTGPEGNSSFSFPRISMFSSAAPRGNIEILGKKINCFPPGQSLNVYCCENNSMLKAKGNSKFPIVALAGNLNIRKKQGFDKFPIGAGDSDSDISLGIFYVHQQQIEQPKRLILRNTST